MFFDINKNLCDVFTGLDPIKLLDYPAEDVFQLINDVIDYNKRKKVEDAKKSKHVGKNKKSDEKEVIRIPASDTWF